MNCACPIGRREDVADVDAALRRVGAGAESLSAIARRLEISKGTLYRHRTDCLGLGPAPVVVAGTAGTPPEHSGGAAPERRDKAIRAPRAQETSGTPSGTAVSRSPFAALRNPGDDPVTTPRKLVTAEIEDRCMALRTKAKTFAEIAEELGISEDTAMDVVERVLLRTRNRADSKAEGARALAVRQCDAIIASFWERATDPARSRSEVPVGEDGSVQAYDPSQDKAATVLLKAMERRAKLLGLDTPTSGPLVQINLLQAPPVQNFVRVTLLALERHPLVRAEVVEAWRKERLGPGGGSAPALLVPQVIEMVPELPAGGDTDG